jgi:hypothetical protein
MPMLIFPYRNMTQNYLPTTYVAQAVTFVLVYFEKSVTREPFLCVRLPAAFAREASTAKVLLLLVSFKTMMVCLLPSAPA